MEKPVCEVPLVARPVPDRASIEDFRIFAWEILRRRADWRGEPVKIEQIGTKEAPIELILPRGSSPKAALRFRRST